MPESADLERFLRGDVDPQRFSHREHVRMAFEMLAREDFVSALARYGTALQILLARVGRPQAFNQTVTVAYLALIAERMQAQATRSFDEFAMANPELFEPGLLQRWYRREQLSTAAARRIFVMPEPCRSPR